MDEETHDAVTKERFEKLIKDIILMIGKDQFSTDDIVQVLKMNTCKDCIDAFLKKYDYHCIYCAINDILRNDSNFIQAKPPDHGPM